MNFNLNYKIIATNLKQQLSNEIYQLMFGLKQKKFVPKTQVKELVEYLLRYEQTGSRMSHILKSILLFLCIDFSFK